MSWQEITNVKKKNSMQKQLWSITDEKEDCIWSWSICHMKYSIILTRYDGNEMTEEGGETQTHDMHHTRINEPCSHK